MYSEFGLRIAPQTTEGSHGGVGEGLAQGLVGCLRAADAVLFAQVLDSNRDVSHIFATN
jgi:hypothetical protein